MIDDPELSAGWVAAELAAEFPELGIAYAFADAAPHRSPGEVRERLRDASNRFTGAKAVAMRRQPVPQAYRVFFRHIGIDPDVERTPAEAIAVERMRAGGFVSRGLIDDALLLGTLETGVPLQAFDAGAIEGRLGLRLAAPGESLGTPQPLASGSVVIADERRPLAQLFRAASRHAEVRRSTRRVAVAAVTVAGVPGVSVEEALWTALDTLNAAG